VVHKNTTANICQVFMQIFINLNNFGNDFATYCNGLLIVIRQQEWTTVCKPVSHKLTLKNTQCKQTSCSILTHGRLTVIYTCKMFVLILVKRVRHQYLTKECYTITSDCSLLQSFTGFQLCQSTPPDKSELGIELSK